jgi:hypothetical protein
MTVMVGQVSQPHIVSLMIYWILECHEDHTKQPMEYGDLLPSDVEDK